jgi:nucleotide-binding universal stress UspA family protein
VTYRTIVVGTDGSETAVRAINHAIGLAAADDARLVVVTAFERHESEEDDRIPADVRWMLTDSNEAERHARHGRELAHDGGVSDVVVQAVEGDPSEMLLETAKDFNADLIVVGSVGLTASTRFILGSVAGNVLHHAPCDVLVVHTH